MKTSILFAYSRVLALPLVIQLFSCSPNFPTTEQDSAYILDRAFNVLDAYNDEAFLNHFRALQVGEDTARLDNIISQVFPIPVENPGEREALHLLSFVSQTLRMEASGRHLGSEVLADGFAYCYGMARAFEALCRRLGFPARINAVHNIKVMQAHNMVDLFYDGKWHMFDPTYGIFFYDRPQYDGEGAIPSTRELLSGGVSTDYAFRVCHELWSGTYTADWEVFPLADDFRYRGAFTVRELYDTLFAQAFPFVESHLEASSFPVVIDMRTLDALSIGERDGSSGDVEGRRADATYPRYQGTARLGQLTMGPAFHTVTFQTDVPGRFELTYYFLPGSRFSTMGTVELKDVIVESQTHTEDAWSVVFRVQTEEALFLVVNRRHTAVLDAIAVKRLD